MSDSDDAPATRNTDDGAPKKHSLLDVLKSILWGALGVQSNKNREKDFQHGSLKMFLAAGVIFTVLFIMTVLAVVKFALRDTGL